MVRAHQPAQAVRNEAGWKLLFSVFWIQPLVNVQKADRKMHALLAVSIFFIFKISYSYCKRICFTCMYVCMRLSGSPELEIQLRTARQQVLRGKSGSSGRKSNQFLPLRHLSSPVPPFSVGASQRIQEFLLCLSFLFELLVVIILCLICSVGTQNLNDTRQQGNGAKTACY